ncbi:MAG: anti-sigma factor family protein [Acidimicrobiales bacterium]
MNKRDHRMLCRGVEAYLDGEANPALAARVQGHLAECWSCSEDAEWLTLVKVALRQIGDRRPPELVMARLTRYACSISASR